MCARKISVTYDPADLGTCTNAQTYGSSFRGDGAAFVDGPAEDDASPCTREAAFPKYAAAYAASALTASSSASSR